MNSEKFLEFKKQTKKVLGKEVEPFFQILENKVLRIGLVGNGINNSFLYERIETPKDVGYCSFNNKTSVTTFLVEKGEMCVIEKTASGIQIPIFVKPGENYMPIVNLKYDCHISKDTIVHKVETKADGKNFNIDIEGVTKYSIFDEVVKEHLKQDVNISFEIMPNGESRTRITGNGNINPFSYIRVEMPETVGGGWQNAHYHYNTIETWILEKGIQVIYEKENYNTYKEIIMKYDDVYTSKLRKSHNCYVSGATTTHTVKWTEGNHGFDGDWHPDEVVDEFTKKINMEKFLVDNDLEKYS